MENDLILLDSSILIDYFRKKNKERSAFVNLAKIHQGFAISVVTRFEVLVGRGVDQLGFWEKFMADFTLIPLDKDRVDTASEIQRSLRRRNLQIPLADLFIAATAIHDGLPVATLNRKHFERVEAIEFCDQN